RRPGQDGEDGVVAGAGISHGGSQLARGDGGDVHDQPVGTPAEFAPLPGNDQPDRKPTIRSAQENRQCEPLEKWRNGAALGGGSIPADGKTFPQNRWVRKSVDVGHSTGAPNKIRYLRGEVRVTCFTEPPLQPSTVSRTPSRCWRRRRTSRGWHGSTGHSWGGRKQWIQHAGPCSTWIPPKSRCMGSKSKAHTTGTSRPPAITRCCCLIEKATVWRPSCGPAICTVLKVGRNYCCRRSSGSRGRGRKWRSEPTRPLPRQRFMKRWKSAA